MNQEVEIVSREPLVVTAVHYFSQDLVHFVEWLPDVPMEEAWAKAVCDDPECDAPHLAEVAR